MSQHSGSSSSRTSSGIEATFEIASRVHSVNVSMDNAINVAPLAIVYPTATDLKKGQSSHATGSKGKYTTNLHQFASTVLKDARPNDTANIESSPTKDPSPVKEDDQCIEDTNPGIDVDVILSDDELILNVNPSISKRLRTRKGKDVLSTSPPKCSMKKAVVEPPKTWIKVKVPSKKRKVRLDTESEADVESDVQDIVVVKMTMNRRSSVPDAPLENISFHFVDSVERWRYVY